MKLIQIGDDTFINPEHVCAITQEREVGGETYTAVYTADGSIFRSNDLVADVVKLLRAPF